MGLQNRIRELRLSKKYSVEKLAEEVGVTRQALWMIETGKVSPNTSVALRLAKVFDIPVERLFWEDGLTLDARMAGTGDGELNQPSRVYLGKIRGVPVARQMSTKDGFGQLLSSAQGVIEPNFQDSSRVRVQMLGHVDRIEHTVFISGCELGLGLFSAYTRRAYTQSEALWFNVTNQVALNELQWGETHIAALHMNEDERALRVPDWVLKECNQYLFASEEIGWIVPYGNPKGFRGAEDLLNEKFRIINRPAGAGARVVLDEQLKRAHVRPEVVPGYFVFASGHYEVAELISRGLADVGVGHSSAAALLGLHFLPIHTEQCWLVVPKGYEQLQPVQAAIEVLHSDTFRFELEALAPYDVRRMGQLGNS